MYQRKLLSILQALLCWGGLTQSTSWIIVINLSCVRHLNFAQPVAAYFSFTHRHIVVSPCITLKIRTLCLVFGTYLINGFLNTIYKLFIRQSCYGNTLSDQFLRSSFHERLGLIQFNAALGIRNTIIGRYRERLYQEMDL